MSCKPDLTRLDKAARELPNQRRVQTANLVALVTKIHLCSKTKQNVCYYSNRELAEMLFWSLSKFKQMRRLAEQLGWIKVQRRKDRMGRSDSNMYTINWSKIYGNEPQEQASNEHKNNCSGGGKVYPDPGKGCPDAGKAYPDPGRKYPTVLVDAPARTPAPENQRNKKGNKNQEGKAFGFFKNGLKISFTIDPQRMTDPAYLERVFCRLLEENPGKLHDTFAWRVMIYGILYACSRGRNPGGFAREVLSGRAAWDPRTDADDDWAVKQVRYRENPRARRERPAVPVSPEPKLSKAEQELNEQKLAILKQIGKDGITHARARILIKQLENRYAQEHRESREQNGLARTLETLPVLRVE